MGETDALEVVVETPDGDIPMRVPPGFHAGSVVAEACFRGGYRYTPSVHQLVTSAGDPLRPGGTLGGQGVSDGARLFLDANPEEAE